MTRDESLARIIALEQRGELLRAVDFAAQTLKEHPGDKAIAYRLVLCLARAGATETARRRYVELELDGEADEDSAALGARLCKDRALVAQKQEKAAALVVAAERYAEVYERTKGYFPAINSATLFRLADDPRAPVMARGALAAIAATSRTGESYYEAATRAEAHLVLGEEAEARAALTHANEIDRDARSARASTRRQLRLLCRHLGIGEDLLDALANPPVLHFCGHRIVGLDGNERLPLGTLESVAKEIEAEIEAARPCAGYGSLAAGADILFAEALLRRGAELHVILPCDQDDFLEQSVGPAGVEWIERFHRCIRESTSLRYVTNGPFLGDSRLFLFASSVAMGLALLRATMLDSRPIQMAVWDQRRTASIVGTEGSIELWGKLGRAQVIIDSRLDDRAEATPSPATAGDGARQFKALVFGDFDGFSSLPEALVPEFVRRALGAVAATLQGVEGHVALRNTWGDGLYVVFDDLLVAGHWALALQDRLQHTDWRGDVLPSSLNLRVSCHYGPVFECDDPVVGRPGFFGTEVSKTARIEPITPEGSVYVTEPFAALLALEPGSSLACDYVGTVPTAKGYGDLPLYLLRRTAS